MPKPALLHDRTREWDALSAFATDTQLGAKLGLVYGRRRQGKTLMLDLVARAVGGFVFTALPQSSTQILERLSRSYARFTEGADVTFRDWDAAVDALLRLGERGEEPAFVFIDEFQYLVEAEPAPPSILQIALTDATVTRELATARSPAKVLHWRITRILGTRRGLPSKAEQLQLLAARILGGGLQEQDPAGASSTPSARTGDTRPSRMHCSVRH